ncbi:hypothetical protein FEM48_Zijuj08G0185100 [Ziziphus jujuba var. spinosa]|uniref:Protein kinase domain-containing protein n=1 Tax=Ziziphus jujuba var. spinosa TaxID=714518 RepID=A0A978V0P0_ZIZJJ|nr:hypothetical protein FEM48_Zijuj08G0185100 [Ziziphus jujuba var. spinosa]
MEEDGTTLCNCDGIRVGDYILESKLGEGSFSVVWKAQHSLTGQQVALKQVYLSKLNRHLRSCLNCELTFLSSVNHPNIIRLFHVFQLNLYADRILVLCLLAFVDCASSRRAALELLHSHHIIHRDLKPENILLSGSEDDLLLKIADFGLSGIVLPDDFAETVCGSPLYMAPEVLQFQRYDEKVDMWSVGAILFELLNGYPPFRGRSNVQVLKKIKSSTCLPFSQLILPGLNPDCLDICTKLLSRNPGQRLSFHEFSRHKFLR